MANAAWPASLPPNFLQTDYRERFADVLLRTKMDTGPDKVRRRFTAGVQSLSGSMLMTGAQLATLESFFATTLQGGALPFDWVHPRSQSAITCRFVEPPQITGHSVDRYRVGLKLEVLP